MKSYKFLLILILSKNFFINATENTNLPVNNSNNTSTIITYTISSAAALVAYKILLPKTLLWALENEYEDLALRIIQLKPNLDYQDAKGKTAYHYAFELNLLVIIDELFKISSEDIIIENYTAPLLFWSAKYNRISYIRKIVKKDLNLDFQDELQMTALMYAVAKKNSSLSRILLMHGANTNIKAKNGTTAILEAVKSDCFECIANLLLYEADYKIKDNYGHDVLYYGAKNSLIKEIFSLEEPASHPKIKEYLQY